MDTHNKNSRPKDRDLLLQQISTTHLHTKTPGLKMFATPKRKSKGQWRDTPIPKKGKVTHEEISPLIFYAEKKDSPPLKRLHMPSQLQEHNESTNRCLECGIGISPHAQLCGKQQCLHILLSSSDDEKNDHQDEKVSQKDQQNTHAVAQK